MAEAATLTALNFLPDNLKKNELYQELAQGIDLALEPGTQATTEPLDSILAKLQLNYADQEAVTAYYNHFVKPVIGTRSALEFAFNLLNVQTNLVEWFDFLVPAAPFKFQLTFDVFPGNLDFEALIRVIFALKNERSFLSAIRMLDCGETMILDFGYLDRDHLSATEGYIDPVTNVLICLYQEHLYPDVSAEFAHPHQMSTHIYTQYYLHTVYPTLDNFAISLPWDPLYYNIIGSRGAISGFLVNYSLADEFCANPTGMAHQGYCSISLIDRAPYHTGTYQNQIVPSEFETLSDGMGFPGEHIETYTEDTETGTLAYDLYLSDLYRLSQVTIRRTPLIEFFWEYRTQQLVDTGFEALLAEGVATHLYTQYIAFPLTEFLLDADFLSELSPFRELLRSTHTVVVTQTVRAKSAFELLIKEGIDWNTDLTWTTIDTWITPVAGFVYSVEYNTLNPQTLSFGMTLSAPFEVIESATAIFTDPIPDISLTTIKPYRTGWGDNTIVPSEEGLLSEGPGGSPMVIPDEFYVVILSDNLTLSGEPFIWRPIYTLDYSTREIQYLSITQPVVTLDMRLGISLQYIWAAQEYPVDSSATVSTLFYISLDLAGDTVGAPHIAAFTTVITEQQIVSAFEQTTRTFSTHLYAEQLIYPERTTALTTAHFYAQQVTRTDYSFGMYPPVVWDLPYWPDDWTWRNFSYQPRVRTARYTEDVVV